MKGKGAISTILPQTGLETGAAPASLHVPKRISSPSQPTLTYFASVSYWLWDCMLLPAVGPGSKDLELFLLLALILKLEVLNLIILHLEHFGACTSSLLPSCFQRACASPVFQASWSTSANIQAQAKLSCFKWSCPTGGWQQNGSVHETPPNVGVAFGGEGKEGEGAPHL